MTQWENGKREECYIGHIVWNIDCESSLSLRGVDLIGLEPFLNSIGKLLHCKSLYHPFSNLFISLEILILTGFIVMYHLICLKISFKILFVSGMKIDKEVIIKEKTNRDSITLDFDKLSFSNSASTTVVQSRKDPLNWFGTLLPGSLCLGQKGFQDSADKPCLIWSCKSIDKRNDEIMLEKKREIKWLVEGISGN